MLPRMLRNYKPTISLVTPFQCVALKAGNVVEVVGPFGFAKSKLLLQVCTNLVGLEAARRSLSLNASPLAGPRLPWCSNPRASAAWMNPRHSIVVGIPVKTKNSPSQKFGSGYGKNRSMFQTSIKPSKSLFFNLFLNPKTILCTIPQNGAQANLKLL